MNGQDGAPAAPADVLAFWRAAGPDKWFTKDAAFDAEIGRRFLPTYQAAVASRLAPWEATPDGALALVVALDQFPRNMFRGDARTFAADPLARAVADRAISRGFDQQVPQADRQFFYLPFEHSELLAVSRWRAATATMNSPNTPCSMPTSSGVSDASPTATPSWAAAPRPTNKPSSTAAALPAD